MLISAPVALRWMEILAALAVLQGTFELLAVRAAISDTGTWRWSTLRAELPWLGGVLAYRPFIALLLVRGLAAAVLLTGGHGNVTAILWVTSLLVNVRFRGTFNGGSDMMLMVVLSALVAAHVSGDSTLVVRAALLYVAAHSLISYFIAGASKLASASWRSGAALAAFASTPHFAPPKALGRQLHSPARQRAASWAVIAFECSVPLVLVHPTAATAFVIAAFCFHLGNVWAFGLNRFLIVWAATWPALVYASTLIR